MSAIQKSPVRFGNRTARCAHDDCAKTIREGTWNFPTGLCVQHQPKPEQKPMREGVRLAVVYLIPGCSTLPARHFVSVAKEPWA